MLQVFLVKLEKELLNTLVYKNKLILLIQHLENHLEEQLEDILLVQNN